MNARHEAIYQALRDWRVGDVLTEIAELAGADPDFAAFVYFQYLREDDAELKAVLLGLWRAATRRARPNADPQAMKAIVRRVRAGEDVHREALALMEATADAYAILAEAFDSERNRDAKRRFAQHVLRYRAYGPAVNFLLRP